jgi:hypothetical protein
LRSNASSSPRNASLGRLVPLRHLCRAPPSRLKSGLHLGPERIPYALLVSGSLGTGGLLVRYFRRPCRFHRQLVPCRPGDGRGLDLPARHLPRELSGVARRLAGDKHLRALPLPGQRDIARRPAPMLGVVEIGVVQGLALPLVDRPGVTMPEARERGSRPRHRAPAVERRSELSGAAVDTGDRADIAVVDPRPLVGVGELHRIADRKVRRPVLGLEPLLRASEFAALAPHPAQFGMQHVDIAVGVGEHKARCGRLHCRVQLPGPYESRPSRFLVFGPGDRPGLVVGRNGFSEPPLSEIARHLSLPVHLLTRHLGDFGRTVTLLQFGEQPAALNAGELPVIAGEDHLGAGLARHSQQLAGDAIVQHRCLVEDDDSACVPARAAVLQSEQLGVHCACLGEPVRFQVLRHGIRRRQSDRPMPGQLMRVRITPSA